MKEALSLSKSKENERIERKEISKLIIKFNKSFREFIENFENMFPEIEDAVNDILKYNTDELPTNEKLKLKIRLKNLYYIYSTNKNILAPKLRRDIISLDGFYSFKGMIIATLSQGVTHYSLNFTQSPSIIQTEDISISDFFYFLNKFKTFIDELQTHSLIINSLNDQIIPYLEGKFEGIIKRFYTKIKDETSDFVFDSKTKSGEIRSSLFKMLGLDYIKQELKEIEQQVRFKKLNEELFKTWS